MASSADRKIAERVSRAIQNIRQTIRECEAIRAHGAEVARRLRASEEVEVRAIAGDLKWKDLVSPRYARLKTDPVS